MRFTRRVLQTWTLVFACLLFLVSACSDPAPTLDRLPADATILAFGDSLTHGTGAKKGESYPAVLQELSARSVINAGVPGEISENGLKRLPALLQQHQPDLLILCHGGNDILRKKDMKKMQANLRSMIRLASDREIPVVLMAVPKFGLFLSAAPEYVELAENVEVIFIESLIPDILSEKSLKADSVHPNAAGYRKMATTIYQLLQERGAF